MIGKALRRPVLGVLLWGMAWAAQAAPTASASANPAFDRSATAAKAAMVTEPGRALVASQAALAAAAKTPPGRDRDLETATADWLMGEALTRTKHPERALPILDAALGIVVKAAPGGKLHGDILKSRGHASATLGRVQAALQDFHDAFTVYQRAGERRGEAMALQEIGSIYTLARDYPHQLQYYAQAREVFPEDAVLTLSADNNGADALKNMGRLSEAEAAFRKAFIGAEALKSGALKANILATLAFTEALDGKIDAARFDAKRGLALADRDPEARAERPFLLGALAKADAASGDAGAAARRLDATFAGMDLTKTQMEFKDFHELAAGVYEATGDQAKALAHLKAFKRLDDQGRALAASANAALVAAKFDFASQATKIAELKFTQAQSRARFTMALTAILLSAALVVTILISHAFFTMRRSRNRIRAVNAELEHANGSLEKALKAKTEFLATTSHEIRTPLNGILGMAQVMLADRALSRETRERLVLLKGAGDTMNTMVSDLLDVAKIESGVLSLNRTEIDLTRLLEDTAALWRDQAKAKGLSFIVDLKDCPRRVVEDGDRLRQVLSNLLSNAVKFTESGVVTLRASVAQHGEGERVILAVSDTGIGIAPDQHERIFESFTQVDGGTSRQYGGTGLGLTICRNIATALGGKVMVESSLGAGSTFTVGLPLTRVQVSAQSPAEGPLGLEAVGLAAKRLVIMEDNLLAQAMLRALLADRLGSVSFVRSVDEAQESLASLAVDGILADGGCLARQSPEDPFEPFAALTRATPLPVIALWPNLNDDVTANLLNLGAALVIGKPVAGAALLQHLEACLVSNSGEGAALEPKAA